MENAYTLMLFTAYVLGGTALTFAVLYAVHYSLESLCHWARRFPPCPVCRGARYPQDRICDNCRAVKAKR